MDIEEIKNSCLYGKSHDKSIFVMCFISLIIDNVFTNNIQYLKKN